MRVVAFICMSLLASSTAFAEPTEGEKKAMVMPNVVALSDCIAFQVVQSADREISPSTLGPMLTTAIGKCEAFKQRMISYYDSVFAPSQGQAFFDGPYRKDLPRAVMNRIKSGIIKQPVITTNSTAIVTRPSDQSLESSNPKIIGSDKSNDIDKNGRFYPYIKLNPQASSGILSGETNLPDGTQLNMSLRKAPPKCTPDCYFVYQSVVTVSNGGFAFGPYIAKDGTYIFEAVIMASNQNNNISLLGNDSQNIRGIYVQNLEGKAFLFYYTTEIQIGEDTNYSEPRQP